MSDRPDDNTYLTTECVDCNKEFKYRDKGNGFLPYRCYGCGIEYMEKLNMKREKRGEKRI